MGNVIIGQSGGPSAVINASLAGAFVKAKDMGIDKIYGMRNGIQGLLEGRYVDLKNIIKSDVEIATLRKTPAAFLGSCRRKLPPVEEDSKIYAKIFSILNKLNITSFIYIGGNDSMDTCRKLSDYAKQIGSDICFVGAPKTIDNDLAGMDHAPGYGSAAKYIATSIKECMADEYVYSRRKTIYVMEVMGRNAGWLTAATALAKDEDCDGPDAIYLPEVDFSLDKFKAKITELLEKKPNIMIAVSEGIHTAGGTYICEMTASSDKSVDAFGHKQMGGTATFLADFCERNFDAKTRAIELSTLQRCSAHFGSQTDVDEAFATGGKAMEAAINGQTGVVAALQRQSNEPYYCTIDMIDLHKVSNIERKIPLEWITEDGTYVSKEFIQYARPLIRGESIPFMINGIPKHLVLK